SHPHACVTCARPGRAASPSCRPFSPRTRRPTRPGGSWRRWRRREVKIVVVGGGIIGCATAYELARTGCAVTLLERATPGAEASGAAAGMLVPLGETARSSFAGGEGPTRADRHRRRARHPWHDLPALHVGGDPSRG